ncbi:MAG: PHP domain-containing protein [Clostridia bacterium]|nr:PHP domain-containing protein [Clostridia bacterium]
MKRYLFKSNANVYKANLHCHTTISDGTRTPRQIKAMYKAKGYSVVAFTDHDILQNHSYLSGDGFLAINACELGVTEDLPGEPSGKHRVYHFNLYSPDPNATQTPAPMDMAYDDLAAINQYISDRVGEGYLVSYNHPYWSLQTYADYSGLKGCFAMEIYNHGCEVKDGYYGYNPQVYDEMLRCQNKIYCLSTDDNHNAPSPDPQVDSSGDSFGGFVMINGNSLTYSNIFASLRQGDFYASQGPEIYQISLHGNILGVKCSKVCLIVVYTDGRRCHIQKGEALTEAEFPLNGNEKYIRVMCRDKEHKDANSNAYWL